MPISGFAGQATGPVFNSPELFPFRGLAQRFLPLERIRELYRRSQQPINRSLLENVLAEMRVEYRIAQTDLERIPATGPLVVAANHPFGLLDGAILGALLARVRPDVKVLTNYLLADIPELQEHCIFVDPFGNPESAALNRHALRRCVFWLRTGGMLAIFPAGEVSHLDFREFGIVDPKWNPTVARLVRLTGADALPVYFRGHNSAPFQAIGLLHPALRTAWLLNEFLGQEGKKVEVRVGNRISGESWRLKSNDCELTDYLRWRTYLLAHREPATPPVRLPLHPAFLQRKQAPVAKAGDRATLLAEIAALAPERRLAENREFATYLALAHEIPYLMEELGRLRELTFRMAGEGTGKCRDLDKFDSHYRHLLLWNNHSQELVELTGWARQPTSCPVWVWPDFIPTRCFATTPNFSTAWARRSNWAVPLFARSTRGNFPHCSCYGKELDGSWHATPKRRCCSERSASVGAITGSHVN